MSTSIFPSSLDTYTNPTSTSSTNSPSLSAGQTLQNDSLVSVETKIGVDGSTVVTTLDYKLKNTASVDPGHTHTGASLAAGSVTATQLAANAVTGTAIATGSVGNTQLSISAIKLGYAQITIGFSTALTSVVQIPGLTSTVTIPAGGRSVKITFYTQLLFNSAANRYSSIDIWDGPVATGTRLSTLGSFTVTAGTGTSVTCIAVTIPAAGSKTYNVGIYSDSVGGGTATINSAANGPSFLLVELI